MSSPPIALVERSITDPFQRYRARFVETTAQSGGARTLIELDLEPGGGHEPHRHVTFGERFRVLEGTLTVTLHGEERQLEPGQTVTVPMGALHAFSNRTDAPVRFRIEVLPGHRGLEQAMQIIHGLARDGLVRENGFPRRVSHTAVLISLGESRLSGRWRVCELAFALLARRARRKGVDRELVERYCRF